MTETQKKQYYPLIPIVLYLILVLLLSGFESVIYAIMGFVLQIFWVYAIAKIILKVFKNSSFWAGLQAAILALFLINILINHLNPMDTILLYSVVYATFYLKKEEFVEQKSPLKRAET